jgi:cobalt-zinc-cadmium efflux system protein
MNKEIHTHELHSHTGHHHGRHDSIRTLWIAFFINGAFFIVEVIGGILSGSLALLADAGHMMTDVAALLLAIIVSSLAERLPTPRRTYGLLRAEVLGAFINGAVLVAIVGMIFWESWQRINHAVAINGPLMLGIAVSGLMANAVSAWILFKERNETINIKGAYLHMLADTLGSIGTIIAGAVIWVTGWALIDPIVSFIIGVLILIGSLDLLTQTTNILLESTPDDIDYSAVKESLESIPHVKSVHDLHIWTISTGIPSLSAHIQLYSECSDTLHWHVCLKETQEMLRNRFDIVHSTLQFEPEDFKRDTRII